MYVKPSSLRYRNIAGVKYVEYHWHTDIIEKAKKQCKQKGIKYRMVDNELFVDADRIGEIDSV